MDSRGPRGVLPPGTTSLLRWQRECPGPGDVAGRGVKTCAVKKCGPAIKQPGCTVSLEFDRFIDYGVVIEKYHRADQYKAMPGMAEPPTESSKDRLPPSTDDRWSSLKFITYPPKSTVLKFEEVTVQYVRRRPFSVALNLSGEAHVLDCAAMSIGVHRRCCHGCCQKDTPGGALMSAAGAPIASTAALQPFGD